MALKVALDFLRNIEIKATFPRHRRNNISRTRFFTGPWLYFIVFQAALPAVSFFRLLKSRAKKLSVRSKSIKARGRMFSCLLLEFSFSRAQGPVTHEARLRFSMARQADFMVACLPS
jgi:hypothetical protein